MSHLPPPVKPMTRAAQDSPLPAPSFRLAIWPPFRCDRSDRPMGAQQVRLDLQLFCNGEKDGRTTMGETTNRRDMRPNGEGELFQAAELERMGLLPAGDDRGAGELFVGDGVRAEGWYRAWAGVDLTVVTCDFTILVDTLFAIDTRRYLTVRGQAPGAGGDAVASGPMAIAYIETREGVGHSARASRLALRPHGGRVLRGSASGRVRRARMEVHRGHLVPSRRDAAQRGLGPRGPLCAR